MQHLQELGLELKETMLYWVVYESGHENNFVTTKENAMEVIDESCGMLPAYTLQDVLDALPKRIYDKGAFYLECYDIMIDEYDICYAKWCGAEIESTCVEMEIKDNLIDAAYEMLCWCIENGYAKIGKEASDERTDR